MYSPKISEKIIPELYRRAQTEQIPMTILVNNILRKALEAKMNKS